MSIWYHCIFAGFWLFLHQIAFSGELQAGKLRDYAEIFDFQVKTQKMMYW